MVEEATADGSPEEDSDTDQPDNEQDAQNNNDHPEEAGSIVDDIVESLSDDGHEVYHGREFITVREDGQLAPNSTVVEQYLQNISAVILAYNDSANEIVIVPLEEEYDRPDVYPYNARKNGTLSSRGFLKNNDIMPDETTRYAPEWDEDLGGDAIDGGFRIDLSQDGEVVSMDSGDDGSMNESDDNTATAD